MRAFLLLATLILAVALVGCGGSNDYSQPEAVLVENLECPEGSKGEFNRWGGIDENGWSHSCKMAHGKYPVWKGDVLAIEGPFLYGKKNGEWTFRNKNGDISKIVLYEDGKLISEEKPSE